MTKSLVITKDMIEVVRRLGVETLTARNIAKELNYLVRMQQLNKSRAIAGIAEN